jgi:hypothetical protein
LPARLDGRLLPGQLRTMISEFEQWLRSRTNQEKRPFQEETVVAYGKAARALDAWMTEKKIDRDFTACDTALHSDLGPCLAVVNVCADGQAISDGGVSRCHS